MKLYQILRNLYHNNYIKEFKHLPTWLKVRYKGPNMVPNMVDEPKVGKVYTVKDIGKTGLAKGVLTIDDGLDDLYLPSCFELVNINK